VTYYMDCGPSEDNTAPQFIGWHEDWEDALRHGAACVAGKGNRIITRKTAHGWSIYRERKAAHAIGT
jgi:hypothetical protein